MVKKKRDIGKEILQGLREIKRGDFGRVIKVPNIAKTKNKTVLRSGIPIRAKKPTRNR